MDDDIWRAGGAREGVGAELAAGAAGLLVVGLAMLFLLDLVVGWHLGG